MGYKVESMTTLIGMILSAVFVALAALHAFWVVKGSADLSSFVPQTGTAGEPTFRPGRLATATVALLLAAAAGICASQAELLGLPRWPLARAGVWTLTVLFLLRAIGDFKYVGFFKRIRDTRFGRMDTRVFSPLCLAISTLCGALLWTSKFL